MIPCSFSASCAVVMFINVACMQAKRGLTGIMNYTNPGAISHNEIMELYKSYVDPEFTWKNFSVEEQAEVIKAPRSNNLLDTNRVRAHSPWIMLSIPRDPGIQMSALSEACSQDRDARA